MTEVSFQAGCGEGRTRLSLHGRDRCGELLRVGLVPLFVLLCYQWEWRSWRALVTGAVVAALQGPGFPAHPLSSTTFAFSGTVFQIAISCTALDVFFGSIPLLWEQRRPVSRNLLFFAGYFLCLGSINLARLTLGFILYSEGLSWFLAHEAMSGVFYFAVFLWISRRRGWFAPRLPAGDVPPMLPRRRAAPLH